MGIVFSIGGGGDFCPAFTRFREILKTAKNVTETEWPPVHSKVVYVLPKDFEN